MPSALPSAVPSVVPSVAPLAEDREPDAAAVQAEAAKADALREVERARKRIVFLALPPTAAPIGSARFFGPSCPEEYGLVHTDRGDYCGKLCGLHAHGFCDDDDAGDASARCCGTHACDRRMANRGFVPPDGPMPSACSPDERPAARARRDGGRSTR